MAVNQMTALAVFAKPRTRQHNGAHGCFCGQYRYSVLDKVYSIGNARLNI